MALLALQTMHPFSQLHREMDRLVSGFPWDGSEPLWPAVNNGVLTLRLPKSEAAKPRRSPSRPDRRRRPRALRLPSQGRAGYPLL
jgi:hypothetical protein